MSKELWLCLNCNKSTEPAQNLSACPNCGNRGTPISSKDTIQVKTTVQELRILCHWAERWAAHAQSQEWDGADVMRNTVTNIANRLNRFTDTPLTFSGEIKQLKNAFPTAETNFPVDDNATKGSL